MRLEDGIQKGCVHWFTLQYPSKKDLLLSFAGGFMFGGDPLRRAKTGAKMKAMGYKPGTPDLFFAFPNGGFSGLFIEMKTEKGVVRSNQKEMATLLKSVGYKCIVCRSVDDFIEQIEIYLK